MDILCCDAFEGLRALEDNSIDCTVTSPPYNFRRKKNHNPNIETKKEETVRIQLEL